MNRPRPAVLAGAAMALFTAGTIKLVLWAPAAIDRLLSSPAAEEVQPPQKDRAKVLAETRSALEKAEALTIHWLFFSPIEGTFPSDAQGKPRYFGYPILGTATVESKQDSREILQSLFAKAEPDLGKLVDCFDPQHAIEARLEDGKSLHLVICYHCIQVWIFDGSGYTPFSIGPESERLLNTHLKAGGVEFVDRLSGVS